MKKNYFLLSLLYITLSLAHTYEPMTIEMHGMAALDSSHVVNVTKLVDFDTRVEHLMSIKTKPLDASLSELIDMKRKGLLNAEQSARYLKMYSDRFVKMSHSYLQEIRQFKPMLIKLLEHWAEQHGRHDSLVLAWANIEHGKEEDFGREVAQDLEIFYTFLLDIDMLLKDIMHSCPKSYAHYLQCKKIVEDKHKLN